MAAHLTEEEQLEALKRWWNENGKIVTAAVVIAVGGFWGWTQYQSHKANQAQEHSAMYQRLVEGIGAIESKTDESAKDAQAAEVLNIAKQISSDQSDTLYGNFAQLYLAKASVEEGNLDAAESALNGVITTAANAAIKELAELRLARVYASKGDVEKALGVANKKVSEAFAPLYAEVKGDIYLAQDDLQQAKGAYQEALNALEPMDFMRRNLIQMKLDNTKVASDEIDITPADPHAAISAEES